MDIGNIVKVRNTDIVGKIVAVGPKGLIKISSENLCAFDRNVYSPEELEEV